MTRSTSSRFGGAWRHRPRHRHRHPGRHVQQRDRAQPGRAGQIRGLAIILAGFAKARRPGDRHRPGRSLQVGPTQRSTHGAPSRDRRGDGVDIRSLGLSINFFWIIVAALNFIIFLVLIWRFAFDPISRILPTAELVSTRVWRTRNRLARIAQPRWRNASASSTKLGGKPARSSPRVSKPRSSFVTPTLPRPRRSWSACARRHWPT